MKKLYRMIFRYKILILLVTILYGVTVYFRISTGRMYLPKYKMAATKVAEEYFYQNYSKEIKLSHIEIMRASEMTPQRFCYDIYFYLKEEPNCCFSITVNFDINTNELSVIDEHYLVEAMCKRMEEETEAIPKCIYGEKVEMNFYFDADVILSEETTLKDVKKNSACFASVNTKKKNNGKNKREEVKNLVLLQQQMREMGYEMKYIFYKVENRVTLSKIRYDFPKTNSIDEMEIFLEKVIMRTEE